ncbi:MAG: transposase [Gallionella sp.]
MPANEKNHRVQGTLLQKAHDANGDRAQGALLHKEQDAREQQGHHALRKGRVSIANGVYFVTTTAFERQKLFSDFGAGCAVGRCFEDVRLLGDAKMLAWVLMPDHAHCLLQLGERDTLSVVVNRLKSASARHANRALGRTGAVWARAFHDHALRSEDDLQDVARYVVANPLRAKLVGQLGEYPFWNAVWL